MENNQKKDKPTDRRAARILYAVVVAALCLTVIIIGIVAVANRAEEPTPTGENKTPTATDPDAGNTPATPTGGNDETDDSPAVFLCPLSGVVSKGHDPETLVPSATMGDWRVHTGLDIAASVGDAVCAAADGTVTDVWEDPMMGICVALDHGNGIATVYENLGDALPDGIAAGAAVKAGDPLGVVGETALCEMADAPHLHFEMTVNGVPADPLAYLSAESCAACFHEADAAYEE